MGGEAARTVSGGALSHVSPPQECPGCSRSVHLKAGERERIIAEYFKGSPPPLADPGECARRLALCADCPDLLYGSTCRFCGCLVEVRARIRDQGCPSPRDGWKR
jgi:hypothetical protein